MGLIKVPNEKPKSLKPRSGDIHASTQHSRRSTWLTDYNRMATEFVGATAKILPRKRGSGRGSAARIWPLSQRFDPTVRI